MISIFWYGYTGVSLGYKTEIDTCQQILIHFANLVASAERDECAKLADISVDFWVKGGFPECAEVREAMHIGEAIRARKQA